MINSYLFLMLKLSNTTRKLIPLLYQYMPLIQKIEIVINDHNSRQEEKFISKYLPCNARKRPRK